MPWLLVQHLITTTIKICPIACRLVHSRYKMRNNLSNNVQKLLIFAKSGHTVQLTKSTFAVWLVAPRDASSGNLAQVVWQVPGAFRCCGQGHGPIHSRGQLSSSSLGQSPTCRWRTTARSRPMEVIHEGLTLETGSCFHKKDFPKDQKFLDLASELFK